VDVDIDIDVNLNVNATLAVIVDDRVMTPSATRSSDAVELQESAAALIRHPTVGIGPRRAPTRSTSTVAFRFRFTSKSTLVASHRVAP